MQVTKSTMFTSNHRNLHSSLSEETQASCNLIADVIHMWILDIVEKQIMFTTPLHSSLGTRKLSPFLSSYLMALSEMSNLISTSKVGTRLELCFCFYR
jgi:hypothetical protein